MSSRIPLPYFSLRLKLGKHFHLLHLPGRVSQHAHVDSPNAVEIENAPPHYTLVVRTSNLRNPEPSSGFNTRIKINRRIYNDMLLWRIVLAISDCNVFAWQEYGYYSLSFAHQNHTGSIISRFGHGGGGGVQYTIIITLRLLRLGL